MSVCHLVVELRALQILSPRGLIHRTTRHSAVRRATRRALHLCGQIESSRASSTFCVFAAIILSLGSWKTDATRAPTATANFQPRSNP